MAAQAESKGDAILLLDFANAFDTVSKNLRISLAAKMCPELTSLTWWLYKLHPKLWITPDESIRTLEDTKQGCRISYPVFALAMQYIYSREKQLFYKYCEKPT